MGLYLEQTFKKERLPHNKAAGLIADGGEFLANGKYNGEWSPDLVCVVDNGLFTAAAWVYSKQEMEDFQPSLSDRRPRTWVRYPYIRSVLYSPQAYDEMRADYPNG
jgi:hypothetical protein